MHNADSGPVPITDIQEILEQPVRKSTGHIVLIEENKTRQESAIELFRRDYSVIYLPDGYDSPLPVSSLLMLGFQICTGLEIEEGISTKIDPKQGLEVTLPPLASGRASVYTILGAPNLGKSTVKSLVGKEYIKEDRPFLGMKWPHYTGYLGDSCSQLLRDPYYRKTLQNADGELDPFLLQRMTSENRLAEIQTLVAVGCSFGDRGVILFEDNQWTGIIHGTVQAGMEVLRGSHQDGVPYPRSFPADGTSGLKENEAYQFLVSLNRHMFESDRTVLIAGTRILSAQEKGHLTEHADWQQIQMLHGRVAREQGWDTVLNTRTGENRLRDPEDIAQEVLAAFSAKDKTVPRIDRTPMCGVPLMYGTAAADRNLIEHHIANIKREDTLSGPVPSMDFWFVAESKYPGIYELAGSYMDELLRTGRLYDSKMPIAALLHLLSASLNVQHHDSQIVTRTHIYDPFLERAGAEYKNYGLFRVGLGAIIYGYRGRGRENVVILAGKRRQRKAWSPEGNVILSETANLSRPDYSFLREQGVLPDDISWLEDIDTDTIYHDYSALDMSSFLYHLRVFYSNVPIVPYGWDRGHTLQCILNTFIRLCMEEIGGVSGPRVGEKFSFNKYAERRSRAQSILRQYSRRNQAPFTQQVRDHSRLVTAYVDTTSGEPWFVPIIAFPMDINLLEEILANENKTPPHDFFNEMSEPVWIDPSDESVTASGPRLALDRFERMVEQFKII